jgi:hypothetical protein
MRPLDGPGWRATVVGLTVFLLSGSTLTGLLTDERLAPPPEVTSLDNPHRPAFENLWSTVKEGVPVSEALSLMGPPDEQEARVRQVPSCSGPCGVPCKTFHTCVREYTWLSAPTADNTDTYGLCVDESDIVRQTSTGGRLKMNLAWPSVADEAAGQIVGNAMGAVILGLPLAVVLHATRRWRPLKHQGLF